MGKVFAEEQVLFHKRETTQTWDQLRTMLELLKKKKRKNTENCQENLHNRVPILNEQQTKIIPL